MNRTALTALASLILVLATFGAAQAKVRSYGNLSRSEKEAFDGSKARTIVYDYALRDLDLARQRHKIGPKAYARHYWELVDNIAGEAAYQNAILVEPAKEDAGSKIAAAAGKAWDDWGKYVIEAPVYLAAVVLEGAARSHVTISP
jgi:hypothetical protein